MALNVYADRVEETTTTTGTGTLNLGGPNTQFQSFISGIGNGNTCDYCLLSGNGSDWETGNGTVTSGSPNTLSRNIVYASSNSGSKISLSGTSTVFCSAPAQRVTQSGLWAPALKPPVPTQANTGFTTWLNQQAATVANRTTGITLSSLAQAVFGVNGLLLTPPSPPYGFKALVSQSNPQSVQYMGLGWYDGSAKIQAIAQSLNNSIYVWNLSSVTAFASNAVGPGAYNFSDPVWYGIRDDGTSVYYACSHSGDDEDFVTMYSTTKSGGYLGSSGYSKILWYLNNSNGNLALLTLAHLMSWQPWNP